MKIKALLLACVLLGNPIAASGSSDEEAVVEAAPLKKRKALVSNDTSRNSHIDTLDFSHASSLKNIEFVVYFLNVMYLNLEGCYNLKDSYHSVSVLINLRELNLRNVKLSATAPLKFLTNLTSLNLGANPDISTVKDIITLTRLIRLDLEGNWYITDLERISSLTFLEDLSLKGVFNDDKASYPTLDFVAFLTNLRRLNLGFNDYIFYIKPIAMLPFLTHLDLSNAKEIRDLDTLSSLTTLKKLDLQYLSPNEYVMSNKQKFLKKLTNLKTLRIDPELRIPRLSSRIKIKIRKA